MPHRSPTAADIGKTVEVSNDGENWTYHDLEEIVFAKDQVRYWCRRFPGWSESYRHCRVPYSTPDPIAELSMAADLLAERGADEAARVLMAEIERQRQDSRIQASVERLIADGLGVLPDEPRPNWEEHEHRYYIYRNVNREPVVALRFETEEINAGRYQHDRKNYTVGMWNSHVCPVWHSTHLTWPEGTPINEMQEQIERADIRVVRDLANRKLTPNPEPQP